VAHRRIQGSVLVVAVALLAAACGSSAKSTTSNTTAASTGSGSLPNQRYADNNSPFNPVVGGTLTMLGTGDVDFMDPNISYYDVGYDGLRMWSRQLYTYPATTGKTTDIVPDLATSMPTITNNGTSYAVTIRTGAMWNSTPPRQVTAADVVLGVKRQCNPVQPFGGQPDYSSFIVGYSTFCMGADGKSGFSTVAQNTAAIASYINGNQISGVSVDPSNPLTVDFTLTQSVPYFTNILALPAFSPAPVEFLQYLPVSNALAQHTLSDGPYEVKSYNPSNSIVFVRNPAWQASSDPVRKAYVNEIDINETGTQAAILQQIETNTPQADMMWDTSVPTSAIPGLIASNDPRLSLQSEYSSNPYIIFNTQSPNNTGALGKVAVRQALEYGLNRTNLIQDQGGPNVTPPLTQILPPGIVGASPAYSQYSYNTTMAKSLLASAGYPNGLTLKFLYRPSTQASVNAFTTVQNDLKAIGVTVTGVGVPNADFYTKYLEVPSTAKSGVWDLSLAGWSPDWYGDSAASFFSPLFDGRILPPTSSNFGLFNDPVVNADIDAANKAPTDAASAALWHAADVEVMKQAAIFPISSPNRAQIHGTQVHNCIYVALIDNCDATNVWLTS
jgi:peptide/nickel transport system substrate-binding protein